MIDKNTKPKSDEDNRKIKLKLHGKIDPDKKGASRSATDNKIDSEEGLKKSVKNLFEIKKSTRYTFPSSRAATPAEPIQLELDSDDIVEVELADGGKLIMRADELQELTNQTDRDEMVLSSSTPLQGQATDSSRGLISDIFSAITTLDIDWKDQLVSSAAEVIKHYIQPLEERLLGHPPGLLHWDHTQQKWIKKTRVIKSDFPVLIFLHGTASSTESSFGALWTNEPRQWQEFVTRNYEGRIYSLDHRSLSETPTSNAIDLLKKLARNQEIHLVSHSRGGLIGELLCRGQIDSDLDNRKPVSQSDIDLFKSAYQTNLNPDKNREVPVSIINELDKLSTLLIEKKPKISRFVRVACPSKGTTLADHRADLYLSVLLSVLEKAAVLATPVLGGITSVVKGLAITTAKMRMDFASLPGLESMMPGSGLIKMINNPSIKVDADLYIISGNAEAGKPLLKTESIGKAVDSLKQTLWVVLTNAYYLQANDFVVETTAMDGGHNRSKTAYIYPEKESYVNHFRYFENTISRQKILDVLELNLPQIPPGFLPLTRGPSGERITPSKRGTTPALDSKKTTGIVVMVPGFSGSHLSQNNERIWISGENLALGKLLDLAFDSKLKISADSWLEDRYQSLADYLHNMHEQEVVPFPYDWRLSIAASSKLLTQKLNQLLKQKKPIRILAHGMGGLIVRHMILTKPDLWQRLCEDHDASCIMAGTPFEGSFDSVQSLLQQSPLFQQLLPLNPDYTIDELGTLFSAYPSLIEMLPSFSETTAKKTFFDTLTWESWQKGFAVTDLPLDAERLKTAKELHDSLLTPIDKNTSKIHYLAGQSDTTVINLAKDKDDLPYFETSAEGDGLSPWESIPKWLNKNNIWYMPHVKHGDLLSYTDHFSAIAEILLNGTTTLLAHSAPQSRSLARKKLTISKTKTRFLLPEAEDIETIAMHGSAIAPETVEESQSAHIRVLHGDLRLLDTPIMVGHYIQDGIRGSEAVVDEMMDGWLSELFNNGLYPGPLNSVEIVMNPGEQPGSTKGAVIVGLGSIGELTTPVLRRTLRMAFIRYGLHHAELDKNCKNHDDSKPLTLTTLLVGGGTGGVGIEDSVACLLNALVQANQKLKELSKPTIQRLDIVELYEDIAINAAMALHHMEKTLGNQLTFDTVIKTYSGKQVRSTISTYEVWWRHVQILGSSDGNLVFTPLTSYAGVQTTKHHTQVQLIDSLLEQATKDTAINLSLSRTLFELLLPNSLKEQVRDENGMVLIVNEAAARFPWEMLVNEQSYETPIATEIGFIRKLHSIDMAPHRLARNKQALVVGDTISTLPELIGAQDEAHVVHEELLAAGYIARPALIRSSGIEIVSALMSNPVQILHLAGHGIFLEPGEEFEGVTYEEGMSGMVLGDNHFLTNDEISSLPYIPELIFINCCHLGKIDKDEESQRNYFQSRPKLAANLGTAFIQAGAKCVIAAGWEVDDSAALLFAQEFYHQMLKVGQTFGEATRLARKVVFDNCPGTNTWGAYQCYGDHKFSFKSRAKKHHEAGIEKHHSPRQTIIWANNISTKTWGDTDIPELKEAIDERSDNLPPEWVDNAELHESIAGAYAAVNSFSKAIEWYEKAVACNDSRITLKALEQKANVLVRWAEEEYNTERGTQKALKQSLKHIQQSIDLIQTLHHIGTNKERFNILASAYKHRAMLQLISEKEISDEARKDLCKAYENYMKADQFYYDLKQIHHSYPMLNAIGLWLGLNKLGCTGESKTQLAKLVEIKSYIKELDERLATINPEKRYNFWERTDYLNCKLNHALINKTLDNKQGTSLADEYLNAFKMAKPMDMNSVLKQIRFLDVYLHFAWGKATKKETIVLENLKRLKEKLAEKVTAIT